jgi:hypothetical protein
MRGFFFERVFQTDFVLLRMNLENNWIIGMGIPLRTGRKKVLKID